MIEAYEQSMMGMHEEMMDGLRYDDPGVAFAPGMIPHHQARSTCASGGVSAVSKASHSRHTLAIEEARRICLVVSPYGGEDRAGEAVAKT